MASPVDSARFVTEETTGVTNHVVATGSPTAGTLLVIEMRFNTGPGTVTFDGFTAILGPEDSDASNDVTYVWAKEATGSEGADEPLTTTNVCKIAAVCHHVTGAEALGTQLPEVSTPAVATTAANSCNPGNVNGTGGSKDYLAIAFGGQDGEVGAFTAGPSGYSNFQAANTGTAGAATTNVQIGVASRQFTGASEDPGAFTHAAAVTGNTGITILIHPASGAPPPVRVPRNAGVSLQGMGLV